MTERELWVSVAVMPCDSSGPSLMKKYLKGLYTVIFGIYFLKTSLLITLDMRQLSALSGLLTCFSLHHKHMKLPKVVFSGYGSIVYFYSSYVYILSHVYTTAGCEDGGEENMMLVACQREYVTTVIQRQI